MTGPTVKSFAKLCYVGGAFDGWPALYYCILLIFKAFQEFMTFFNRYRYRWVSWKSQSNRMIKREIGTCVISIFLTKQKGTGRWGVRKNRRNKQWKGLIECRRPLNNFSPRSFFFSLSLSTAARCAPGPWLLIAIGHWVTAKSLACLLLQRSFLIPLKELSDFSSISLSLQNPKN